MYQVDYLNPKSTKAKGEDRIEDIMIDRIMISEIIKTDIGQILETEGSIDKIAVDQNMDKIIEVKILEVMQEYIKVLKDRVEEESTGIRIEMKVIAEIGIGTVLEKDHSLETLIIEEMIEVQVIVGPDQDQKEVQIEIESGVTNVGNTIFFRRLSYIQGSKGIRTTPTNA